ncbi:MAG: ATP synthase F1 subunit epsilon [Pseudomonadota bacterium]|nr:ATP synthase F1 subunit epsilon [Pseudomonadota bacterium]|tara:strand:- start:76 stop:462 length:387 start_codon:yes stop_codon:yes gene_type:complete
MSDKFTVEIISPIKSIIKSDTSEVVIPSYEGEMGILKNHIPIITFLRPGVIKIINEIERNYFVEDGTVEFIDDNLLILTSTAKDVNNFDKTEIDGIISEAEKKIGNSETSDKEKYLLSYKISTLKNLN